MKKTLVALGVISLAAVGWEFYALANPADDVWTFTSTIRALPCWGTVLMVSFLSALAAHVWWR